MCPCLHLLLLIPAGSLVSEDFRCRRVSVVWLALLGAGAILVEAAGQGVIPVLIRMGCNLLLLLLLAAGMPAYLLVRGRGVRDFFKRSFGAGDLVFMAAVTPLFGPAGYVRFLLAACVIALVWWAAVRRRSIPLAGIMGVTLAGYLIFKSAGLWS